MGSGLFFPICALPIIIIIITSFNLKKHIKSEETRLFNLLTIANFIGLILEIMCTFASTIYESNYILSSIILKSYLVYLVVWTALFTVYISSVSNFIIKDLYKYIHYLLLLISILIIYFLPIELITKNNFQVRYTAGLSVIFSYGVSFIYVLAILIMLIKRIKNINEKKYLPVILFFIIGIVSISIQLKYPQFLLLTYAETLICLCMYFTIENPDMKVLDELHKAKEITDTANEEKTMFLYNMTNELREITRDIDNEADNILNETDNKKVDIEHINNSAREIKGSTARFTTMTNEILDISTVDATSIKIYNDKYNIKLLIKELVQVYKKASENKGIDFRTSIASDLPEYLYGDIVGLKNSLSTILDNSIKFTEEGYIEFSVNAIIKNDIARLIITIEDSGVGMKADELNKIFNKKSEDKESTDLNENLYNARKLVTLMGGTIIPSSVFGKGTTMKIVIDQKVFNSESDYTKYEKIYDKKRILLVDDSPAGVKIVTKMLNDTNIILDVVSSGKECLDKIRSNEKYDLILLDEEMSPLSGIEVMVKLKEIRNFNTKTILLTKNNDYEYNEEYLKYGFKDYLLKPLDKDKVFEKIDKYLK